MGSAGIWVIHTGPLKQHSHHHKSNRQKASPATPRFGTSMYDPYTSTHIIIRVTAKKRHLLTPSFGTSMYDPYSSTHTSIRVTAKKRHLLTPRFWTCMYDPYTSTH